MRQHNWAEIRRELLAELMASGSETRPLSHVARSLEVPVRSIRAHFPDLCLSLSDRHPTRRRLKLANRNDRLKAEIQSAMAALARHQVVLSKRSIEKLLGRPGLFNSHYARRLYDAARGTGLPA